MTVADLQRLVHRLEDGLLALAVVAMVGLAGVQVVLRGVFETGVAWIEPSLRALVLWIGVLGAVTASRSGRHIRVDLVAHAPPAWRRWLQSVAYAFTALVCALLAWHSGRFVALELTYPVPAFAGVPTWAVALVLPLGFGLIGLRYAAAALAELRRREAFPAEPPC